MTAQTNLKNAKALADDLLRRGYSYKHVCKELLKSHNTGYDKGECFLNLYDGKYVLIVPLTGYVSLYKKV